MGGARSARSSAALSPVVVQIIQLASLYGPNSRPSRMRAWRGSSSSRSRPLKVENMHDPVDHVTIIDPLHAANIGRQMRLDPG